MSEQTLEQLLEAEMAGGELFVGQIVVRALASGGGFELEHRDHCGTVEFPSLPTPAFALGILAPSTQKLCARED